ncbi:MAG: hypothetical protein ACO295_05325 [Sediminibacterium sp.]
MNRFFVVRKHPKGGFTFVPGFPPEDGSIFIDIPVFDHHPRYENFDDALIAAMEEFAKYGVITHPECEEFDNQQKLNFSDDLGINGWEGTD